jgi:hypothetical protein
LATNLASSFAFEAFPRASGDEESGTWSPAGVQVGGRPTVFAKPRGRLATDVALSFASVATGSSEPFGWVFSWVPPDGEPIAGNAPIIVDGGDGSVHFTGTGRPLEVYLEAYARFGPAAFDDRAWERAIMAQHDRQWREHTDARRDGRAEPHSTPTLTIDWDEVAHVLLHGPRAEPAPREPTRCYYCDSMLPPSRAVRTAAGRLACRHCAAST